jgi:hypothetical protein
MADFTFPDNAFGLLAALMRALDEGDDLLQPNGFTRKNLIEAINTTYDAVVLAKPAFAHIPKASLLKIATGLHDTVRGVLEVADVLPLAQG